MSNILIAVDLKATDQQLLTRGLTLAKGLNAKVWIIHVAAPDPDFVGYDVGPQYIRDSRAAVLKTEHKDLETYMNDMRDEGVACEALLIQGPTVELLLEEIDKLAIDWMVMGEHKHGFLYETMIGHTSAKILKHISIPVIIVPLDE